MRDAILSTIDSTPSRKFVYSAWSFYATRRGGELPGPWILAALETLGQTSGAVRQTLYRMERDRELESRRVGRMKYYRLAVSAQQEIASGLSMLFDAPETDWDGQWTLVRFGFDGSQRPERDRLRNVLEIEGFAQLGGGMFIHPRDRTERVLKSARSIDVEGNILVFRGRRAGGETDTDLVDRLWDLQDIGVGYQTFLDRFEPVLEIDLDEWSSDWIFKVRFALVIDYLEVAWLDPELPETLLPAEWPAPRARAVARQLYEHLLPGALSFGDDLMADLGLSASFLETSYETS